MKELELEKKEDLVNLSTYVIMTGIENTYIDPELKIDWGFAASQLILSEKDIILPLLGNHSPAEIPFIP